MVGMALNTAVVKKYISLGFLLWSGVMLFSPELGAQAKKAPLPKAAEVNSSTSPWPFDHRQILLVKDEKQNFPDDAAVAQLMDIFVKRGRVRWVTMKAGTAQILPVDVPQDFAWQSTNAVRELGLKYKVDGIVLLVQKGVQLDLRWYATLDGQPLFFETLSLPAAGSPVEEALRKKRLQDWTHEIWDRIPGLGYVVNRDLGTLKIEGVAQNNVKVGTSLEIRRLVDMERHPLLKTLNGMKTQLTGRATLADVADPLSTAKIDYESQVDPIQPGDRYLVVLGKKVDPAPGEAVATAKPEPNIDEQGREKLSLFGEESTEEKKISEPNSGGLVDAWAGIALGTARYQENTNNNVYKSTGFAPSVEMGARLYVTSEWILEGDFAMSFINYRNTPDAYGSSISSTTNKVGMGAAYRFVFMDEGPQKGEMIMGLGYQRFGMSMSQVRAAISPSSKNYSGFNVNFAVQIPVIDNYAAFLKANRMFGTNLTESPASSGADSSDTYWDVMMGAKYRLNPSADIFGGYRMVTASSDFTRQGSRATMADSSLYRANLFFANYLYRF